MSGIDRLLLPGAAFEERPLRECSYGKRCGKKSPTDPILR